MPNSKLTNGVQEAVNNNNLPDKPWRKLWHLAGGLFFPILAFFIPREALLITVGVITGVSVIWEITRLASPGVRLWSFKNLRILLKREDQIQPTGTTCLLLASLLIFLLFEKYIAITSLLFVAIGDPIASAVGKKYGKHAVSRKTLEGSLACLMSCFLIGILMNRLNPALTLTVATGGAICAAIVEMLSIHVDDNFTMPLLSASVMALVAL